VTLLRLAGGMLGVTIWFALFALALRRLDRDPRPLHFRVQVIEAVLFTLVAALWFASLGHGAWWLLFLVVGLLVEGPVRLRHRADLPDPSAVWRPLLLGTARTVVAGGILSYLL
jgi:hypothetical protein